MTTICPLAAHFDRGGQIVAMTAINICVYSVYFSLAWLPHYSSCHLVRVVGIRRPRIAVECLLVLLKLNAAALLALNSTSVPSPIHLVPDVLNSSHPSLLIQHVQGLQHRLWQYRLPRVVAGPRLVELVEPHRAGEAPAAPPTPKEVRTPEEVRDEYLKNIENPYCPYRQQGDQYHRNSNHPGIALDSHARSGFAALQGTATLLPQSVRHAL